MEWVYQTPDKQYVIQEQNDPEWKEIFGNDITEFLICKYDESLCNWNKKNPDVHFTDYYIFRSEETLKDCFEWLKKNNKISVEEMENNKHLWS